LAPLSFGHESLIDFGYQFPVRHRRHFAMSALLRIRHFSLARGMI
jgi:hypothetical protein